MEFDVTDQLHVFYCFYVGPILKKFECTSDGTISCLLWTSGKLTI